MVLDLWQSTELAVQPGRHVARCQTCLGEGSGEVLGGAGVLEISRSRTPGDAGGVLQTSRCLLWTANTGQWKGLLEISCPSPWASGGFSRRLVWARRERWVDPHLRPKQRQWDAGVWTPQQDGAAGTTFRMLGCRGSLGFGRMLVLLHLSLLCRSSWKQLARHQQTEKSRTMPGDKGSKKTECYRLLKSRAAPFRGQTDDRRLLAQIIKRAGGEEGVGSKGGCSDCCSRLASFAPVTKTGGGGVVWRLRSDCLTLEGPHPPEGFASRQLHPLQHPQDKLLSTGALKRRNSEKAEHCCWNPT